MRWFELHVVVDTNIFVASFLRKGDTRKILFSKEFQLFSPDRLNFEVLAHKEEFKQKAGLNELEFHQALEIELENLQIVPFKEYGFLKQKALLICPKSHDEDWPFIALSMKLNCPLWSNDKALKKQNTVQVLSTDDLMKKR